MNEVYVIAGGEWLRNNLNAIAAFMGTRTWDSIEKIALTLSVLAVAVMWVQRHNVMDLLGWVAVFVLISLLVNVRTSVQIIDNSDLVKVHRVDNVPVGLAMPLSLTTRIGHAMVASYEMIFTQPDSVTYSKTGMLFGAELVSKSTDFLSRNPEIANLFQDYVQNCVMGDIYLNHKYTLEELMASADPYTLIFSRPSPLRGVYDSNNNFVTCKDASVSLKDKLNLDTQSGGKTWHYYAQQLFGGRPDPNLLFSTLIGDSYSYFYGSSKSASQIIRQNVTINALKEGITSYAARNGDSASLVNLATTSSMEKQRLAHVSIGHVAMRTLPMTQTILTGIASRMRSAVESYAKAHNISNEQATRELASRSTRGSAGMYGDAHAEWGVKPKILGVGGGVGVRGGGRASIDWSDEDAHQASSGSRASHDARHDIDARATQDFKEASDYFTSRKVSESGSHTDNNADSRVDQLSAALNSAKQSYDQYTTNMTRSHEYAEMASRTESMSGQMSEDLSQQFAQYVMKHAPQDAEAILTNTSSPEIAERRRAMAWSFVQEQVQPGVDNAWRESRGDIGKGMESVPSGGGSQDIIADHQGHQAIIEQRTQDSNIRNDVKHQVDNMVTEYRGNIGDTQSSIRGEENIVGRQYSELQNHHKTEALSQNNKYNEEKSGQERMPGADSPQELMKRAKEYQDKHKQ
ncbi:TPA: conjugal transfer protein TraG N-terminal domain-containing protein [Escherichia coli]